MICIKMIAPNDNNGNPRRVFVIMNMKGDVVEAIDEGYNGNAEVNKKYPKIAQAPNFHIPPKEYKAILKAWEKKVQPAKEKLCPTCGEDLNHPSQLLHLRPHRC